VTNEEAHRRARERGPVKPLYAVVRALVAAFMRVWFRLSITGAGHIPAEGAAIVTPNHKSFWDSFFVGAATRRPVRFMGKAELFEGAKGPLLVALGAFPVRRGSADEAALETARVILRQGGLLSLFPEGTRVRDRSGLGEPRRGAARLALETGAPLVPAAITGTDRLFLGPLPKPKRVRLAFAEPIPVHELEPTPEAAASLLDEQLWPEVEGQFRTLLSRKGAVAAGLAALGVGAGVAARRRSRRPSGPLQRLGKGIRRKPKRRFPGRR
jgi:1-acyl-sn-glycerol-3-phosphate acyltransferase